MQDRWTKLLAAAGCLAIGSAHAVVPDAGFGAHGVATLEIDLASPMSDVFVEDGLVDHWGRIVTAGTVADGHYGDAVHRHAGLIARHLPDGTFDTSFDLDGQRILDWQGRNMEVTAVREQPDGRLLIAGATMDIAESPLSSGVVCRLEEDGSYDASFGTGGCRDLMHVLDAPGAADIIDIEVLPDDRILALGVATPIDGKQRGPAVIRLSQFGKVDLSFGNATPCTTPAPRCGVALSHPSLAEHLVPAALAVDHATQRIVVATSINVDGLHVLPVLSLDADGGEQSVAYTFTFATLGYAGNHQATNIHSAPDGSTFVTGVVESDGDSRPVVAKLDPSGTPDAAFGNAGRAVGDTSLYFNGSASLLEPGGALIVASARKPADGERIRCRLDRFNPATGEDMGFSADDAFVSLDGLAEKCSAQAVFAGAGGLLLAGHLFAPASTGESGFILRLDVVTLMRDSFED